MERNGLAWAIGCVLVAATCTAGSGVSPSDGAVTGDATPGAGGGNGAGRGGSAAAGITGAAGGARAAGGAGAAGGARGSSCPCAGALSLDLAGDGDPLHLTSGDYVAAVHARLPIADLTMSSPPSLTLVPACLAEPRPWAESLNGGFSRIYWVQACAGPGGAPPCVWLNPDSLSGSLYVDRSGHEILGSSDAFDSSFHSFETPIGETMEGTFSMKLEDGRTLTASFRVCLLATFSSG